MASDACLQPPPAGLLAGIREFNRGEFFECHETLEELWMAEVDASDLPFGVLVAAAESGETSTSSDAYDFQAFQINPTAVYLVDAMTGKRRRVRDVSFVGTPLAAIQGVLALGDDPDVDNSYCSAESGSVPVGRSRPRRRRCCRRRSWRCRSTR